MRRIYNCFFLLLFLVLISCTKKEDSSTRQAEFTNMKNYVENKCSMCHSVSRVFQKTRKPEEWENIVRRMGQCNSQFIDAEVQQKTFEYLTTNEFASEKVENTQKEMVDTSKPE